MTPRVRLCHHSRLVSECLSAMLTEAGTVDCAGLIAESLDERSFDSPEEIAADLLLLDVTLGGELTHRLAQLFKTKLPNCKVALLVPEHALDRMLHLTHIATHGCLSEGEGIAHAKAAISTILSGEFYCSPKLTSALWKQVAHGDNAGNLNGARGDSRLTAREREVLELIADERLGNKQIARRLGVSLYTVKNHVHNIIDKLGVQDRNEAVLSAKRQHLLVRHS